MVQIKLMTPEQRALANTVAAQLNLAPAPGFGGHWARVFWLPDCGRLPQQQTTLPTLARFLARIYDDYMAPHEAKRAIFEPRRVVTPDAYPPPKWVPAGLY